MTDLRHSFPGQKNDEAVFVFARPYPLAFLPMFLGFTGLYLLSLIVQYGILTGTLIRLDAYWTNIGILFFGVFQLVSLIVFFVALFDFYFDIVIVTDRRLVDIDQEQLLFRRISELSLEDIEDVTSIQKGLLQTLFNYGRVEIQTAGNKENFTIDNIHFPREVTAIILDLKDQDKRDVAENTRIPHAAAVGMINNEIITSSEQLMKVGGLTADDTNRIQ